MGVEITGALKNILGNPDKFASYAQEAFSAQTFDQVSELIEAAGGTVSSRNSKRMTYTMKRLSNKGVIDLKPFFKASSKAKKKQNGGWYMVIPIRKKTRTIQKEFGRKEYDRIRGEVLSSGSKTVKIGDLSNLSGSTGSAIKYNRKSNNITATPRKDKNGKVTNTWTMFRTVSDKSSPTSWVLGKDNIKEDDISDRLSADIKALINKRTKE